MRLRICACLLCFAHSNLGPRVQNVSFDDTRAGSCGRGLRFGNFRLCSSDVGRSTGELPAGALRLRTVAWFFNLATSTSQLSFQGDRYFVWKRALLSFGGFSLVTFVREPSMGNCVGERSLGTVRFGLRVWDLSPRRDSCGIWCSRAFA